MEETRDEVRFVLADFVGMEEAPIVDFMRGFSNLCTV